MDLERIWDDIYAIRQISFVTDDGCEFNIQMLKIQGPRRGWGWGGGRGGFWLLAFLAVDVRTVNVQLEIFKVLMKNGVFTCFDDILAKIKQLSEAEKCMITEIITLCKLLLVNPATSAAGERSFSSARRLKTWLRSTMTQTRFSNLTILNTHKQRTDKLCLIDVANEFAALNENRKSNFGTFKESDLKMSGWHSSVSSVGFSLEVCLFI